MRHDHLATCKCGATVGRVRLRDSLYLAETRTGRTGHTLVVAASPHLCSEKRWTR